MKKEYGKRQDYPTKVIADGIYYISDFLATDCYLIIGTERALLIDVGTGYGDMRGYIETLTDLPIDVVFTHIHPDHIGGMGQFEKAYAHSADIRYGYKFYSRLWLRKLFKFLSKGVVDPSISVKDVVRGRYKTKLIPIEDNHIFDLGGRKVTCKHFAGHTSGSIILLDDKTKHMFVGDNCCPSPWAFLPNSVPLYEWTHNAKKILALMDTYIAHWGHEGGDIKKEVFAKAIEFADEVINNQPKNTFLPIIKFYPFNDRVNGSIVYRKSNVYKRR
ncbi:MAG: MBL fold metallo-hydrolase [Clostridia bacterium]|nr:MBL fold metallo-hydrolase [Clostridia bacterium]